jgi:hypothetical protein
VPRTIQVNRRTPYSGFFTRMYGTCTWEASVRQRKLSRVPLHLVGNRSNILTLTLSRLGFRLGLVNDSLRRFLNLIFWSGSNSGVECQLPKLDVAGSNPVSRSRLPFINPNLLTTSGSVMLFSCPLESA